LFCFNTRNLYYRCNNKNNHSDTLNLNKHIGPRTEGQKRTLAAWLQRLAAAAGQTDGQTDIKPMLYNLRHESESLDFFS